jgi:hypothetical protein
VLLIDDDDQQEEHRRHSLSLQHVLAGRDMRTQIWKFERPAREQVAIESQPESHEE